MMAESRILRPELDVFRDLLRLIGGEPTGGRSQEGNDPSFQVGIPNSDPVQINLQDDVGELGLAIFFAPGERLIGADRRQMAAAAGQWLRDLAVMFEAAAGGTSPAPAFYHPPEVSEEELEARLIEHEATLERGRAALHRAHYGEAEDTVPPFETIGSAVRRVLPSLDPTRQPEEAAPL